MPMGLDVMGKHDGVSKNPCQGGCYKFFYGLGLPPMQYSDEQFKAWGGAGGRKRAAKLSKRRRRQIARLAARARWDKKKNGAE